MTTLRPRTTISMLPATVSMRPPPCSGVRPAHGGREARVLGRDPPIGQVVLTLDRVPVLCQWAERLAAHHARERITGAALRRSRRPRAPASPPLRAPAAPRAA